MADKMTDKQLKSEKRIDNRLKSKLAEINRVIDELKDIAHELSVMIRKGVK